ncbi:MAG: hypothetical protein EBS44_10420, partial [Betaproteobacteria bacterium]|nr:hypothetical protein [Betaproteobacteria bacterium]
MLIWSDDREANTEVEMALIAAPLSAFKDVALRLLIFVAESALICLVVSAFIWSVVRALKSSDATAPDGIACICVELSVAIPAVVKLETCAALKLLISVAVKLPYWSA